MKLAPNTRYAIRMLFELSASKSPLSLAALSDKTGISLRAVENVQAVLKRHGVTRGYVGARGGIVLTRRLEDISLGRLVELFENGIHLGVCCGEKAYACPQRGLCPTSSSWRVVSQRLQQALNAIPLPDIMKDDPELRYL